MRGSEGKACCRNASNLVFKVFLAFMMNSLVIDKYNESWWEMHIYYLRFGYLRKIYSLKMILSFSQNYKISQNYKYNFRKFSEIYIFCLNLIFLIFAYIRLNPSLVCIQDDGYGMADERLSYLLLLSLPVAWPPAWSLINLFV